MLDTRSVRRRLDEALRTDADLDAYCLDFFPEVHSRFSSQMDRQQKLNLLLQLVPDGELLLRRLERQSDGARPRTSGRASGSMLRPRERSPLAVLQAAIAAVPVMKYALGVAGLAAVVAIATRGFGLDASTAVVGALIVVGLMTALIVLAVAARQSERLLGHAVVFSWTVLVLMLGSAALLLSSFFFSWPKSPPCLFKPAHCEPARAPDERTPMEPMAGPAGQSAASMKQPEGATSWKVAGLVRDARGEPLDGVTVALPLLKATTVTDAHGAFSLVIAAEHSDVVLLRAEKRPTMPDGAHHYRPREIHVHLGSTALDLTLEDSR